MTANTGLAAVDTETTGLHTFHGCYPFMVTACTIDGELRCWEWDIDVKTRKPRIPVAEQRDLQDFLNSYDLIFHNAPFDYRVLSTIKLRLPDWSRVDDTIHTLHVLASGEALGLKTAAMMHCDIENDDEKALEDAVKKARLYGKAQGWNIAYEGHPMLPGDKATIFKADYWIPRAAAITQSLPKEHPWWSVCRTYGLRDVERTMALWLVNRERILEEGLEQQYLMRQRQLEVTYAMRTEGVPVNRVALSRTKSGYEQRVAQIESTALHLVHNKIDNLGSNPQLQMAMFNLLNCKKLKKTPSKKGWSTDKETLEAMITYHEPNSREYHFIRNLQRYKSITKAVQALDSFETFSVSLGGSHNDAYFKLHPNFNITGTRTLRYSSDDPNQQNVSKKEDFNLRSCFGPLPGRIWYSLDYNNIEMRLFAWESKDDSLINAFLSGRSVHLIIAEILHPQEFARHGDNFKKVFESTLYQWIKNGNFSLLYGAGERKADATYRVKGAYRRIRKMLPNIDDFMSSKFNEAKEFGYITTVGGYRLQVDTHEPHKAVNYFVQGSAGYAMILCLLRVFEYLKDFPDHKLIMTVHDQIILDFPQRDPRNLDIVVEVKRLMEMSGQELNNIPLPADVEQITTTWDKGSRVDLTHAI